jgi:putative ABC transport system substrate-binding protein
MIGYRLAAELVGRRVPVIAATGGEASVSGQGGDDHNPDRVNRRRQSGRTRSCGMPQRSRRQRNRRDLYRCGQREEAVGASPSARVQRNRDRDAHQSELLFHRSRGGCRAGRRTLTRAAVRLLYAGTSSEIDAAFATVVLERPDALLVGGDPLLLGQRDQIVFLAERYAVSTICPQREYADAGGLMSYGSNIPEAYRQAGVYTGRILSGTMPAELPELQPTKFKLVINLKAAKALGLIVPPGVLAIADEAIE